METELTRWFLLVVTLFVLAPLMWIALAAQIPFRDPQDVDDTAEAWAKWLNALVAKKIRE